MIVAFASCVRTGSNGAAFDTIRQLDPDLFINAGDLHYGDVKSNSLMVTSLGLQMSSVERSTRPWIASMMLC